MLESNPELIKSMNQSIFEKSYPIDNEILHLNFDELVKSKVIDVIPVLRTINALYKGVLGIRDRFFMRKVVLFINQYNSGVSTSEVQKFVSDVLSDKKFRERVNEKILILLDRFDDELKAKILAELMKNWIKNNIDWNTFERLAYSVDRSHPSVFIALYDYYKNYDIFSKSSQGIYYPHAPLILGSGLGSISPGIGHLVVSKDALDICKYGLSGMLDPRYEKFPPEIVDYLNNLYRKRKANKEMNFIPLQDPAFSEYELWIINNEYKEPNFLIRNGIIEKIRKQCLM